MNTTFVWSTTEKGEKAILYNSYLYRLKRENQNGSLISICTFKWCSRIITLKNDAIIKNNGENHNYDLKLPGNVRTMLCGLKHRRLTDVDEPVTKLYEDEVKRFVKPYKVIAFGSEQALNLLSINPHWNDDGTFRTSPALFIKLSKEENIRRQIANIIALPLIPPAEIDNSMEKIIDELCNYDSKLDKLTDYVIKNDVEDARFAV
ncbi:unnamed protein product [Rotaria sordida]|uniref:FLYWCH-type domain-containing protein n=1 Tax=Rotaria sordida TaxID=392033 RepID=A0A815GQC0_9BILA|nr:unnamed protein product [Rotaria sordida]